MLEPSFLNLVTSNGCESAAKEKVFLYCEPQPVLTKMNFSAYRDLLPLSHLVLLAIHNTETVSHSMPQLIGLKYILSLTHNFMR